jgi:phage/plasmid-associated DNA primase
MEKIFFLFGMGANGKPVFFEEVSGVIGSDNISNYSLESLTDEKGYHRAMNKDKTVNYGTDICLTIIDVSMFKTLASGEPIEARLPYQDPFIMTDYAKLIFNVNKMDSANIEHTPEFYRRLVIIFFPLPYRTKCKIEICIRKFWLILLELLTVTVTLYQAHRFNPVSRAIPSFQVIHFLQVTSFRKFSINVDTFSFNLVPGTWIILG